MKNKFLTNIDNTLFGKYKEIYLIIFGFVLSTLLGGAIINYFQYTSKVREYQIIKYDNERKMALELFENVSNLMDIRVNRMKTYLISRLYNDTSALTYYNEYIRSKIQWNDNVRKSSALIYNYFGEIYLYQFLQEISGEFVSLDANLLIFNDSLNEEKINKLLIKIEQLEYEIYHFNIKMIEKIRNV